MINCTVTVRKNGKTIHLPVLAPSTMDAAIFAVTIFGAMAKISVRAGR